MAKIIYLKIMGNCGNQFFQYAFARVLQERFGGELIIDYSEIHNNIYSLPGSDNLLKEFNTVPYTYVIDNKKNPHKFWEWLTEDLVGKLHLKGYTRETYLYSLFCAKHLERFGVYYFSSSFFKFKKKYNRDCYIKGYFESPKYFEEIDEKICDELTPKGELLEQNSNLYSVICNKESVCIAIKRMSIECDEISDIYNYNLGYYYAAIDYISTHVNNPVWVVFSDNIQWCKDNLKISGDVYYETDNNPMTEKLRLMSACKHFIIHSSTFGWWVQHLSKNKEKIVVAPSIWLKRDDQPIDIYEDNWVYVNENGTIQSMHE